MGQLIAVEDYDNNVGFSERGGQPIEPRLSDQWFMRYPKVAEAKAAVESGAIKFWPKRWEKTYTHWLENIRDWCISRQIWWGHRIPVWYKKGIENHDINNPEHVHVSVEGPADPENWVQDEDSLDTWASSWIWPFGTMGWPNSDAEKQKAMSYFYPTSDLVTGPDIIFFWVARMIMAGLEFLPEDMPEKIPFRNVYFTGIIRDMLGRKMSKSLGNSPDPLDIIARYGADGLRFGVMNCAPQGQDILFSEERVEIGRNFCNKLWNACRFRQMSSEMSQNGSLEEIVSRIDVSKLDADDHAIIASLINVSKQISKDYLNYQFNSITQSLYSFFWNDFCGWYLEVSKSRMADETAKGTVLAVQDLCIRQMLLMLHPFTPFITEELWHSMSFGKEGSFIQNECPEFAEKLVALGLNINSTAVAETEKLKDFVSKARALKAQCNLATKRDSILMLLPSDDTAKTLFEANTGKLKKLVGASEITVVAQQPDAPAVLSELGSIYVDMKGAVDAEAEIKRLEKDKAKLEGAIKSAQARLANEAFTSKAPQNVIDGAKKQLEENIAKLAEIEKLIANFKA